MIVKFQYNQFKLSLEAVGFNDREKELIRQAAYFMTYAMGHEEFKQFCLNYEYKIKYYYWEGLRRKYYYKKFKTFYKSGGRTNFQVYNHLMSGQESLPEMTEIDNEADIWLKVDRRYKKGVVGYTRKNTRWQWLYSWVLKEKSPEYIAGNLAHEWCHKLNYSHSKNNNSHRKHTVTYAVGNYVRDFLEKNKANHGREKKEEEKK